MSQSESVHLEEGRRKSKSGNRIFTVEQANSSLVLVSKVVKDVLALYCRAKILEEHYSVLDREKERSQREDLKSKYHDIFQNLKYFENELEEVGCKLRDWQTGAIEWPAECKGRKIVLCWRMGEKSVEYWHEAYEGFAARKKLESL